MAEAVKVVVRARPMNSRENDLKCKKSLDITQKTQEAAIEHP